MHLDTEDISVVHIKIFLIYSVFLGEAWFLDSVSVQDPAKGEVYEFLCSKWLSVKAEDKKTRRSLEIAASRKMDAGEPPHHSCTSNCQTFLLA